MSRRREGKCSSEDRGRLKRRQAITNAGARVAEAKGDPESFTFCCPFSQCFGKVRVELDPFHRKTTTKTPTATLCSPSIWASIGQA